MSIQIPVGFCNVSINMQCRGRSREYAMTFGIKTPTGGSGPNGVALIVYNCLTTGSAPWATLTSVLDSYTLNGISLTMMTSTGPMPGNYAIVRVGGAAANPSPGNVAYLVRKFSARGGKAGRGRMFAPCFNLSEASIDEAGLMSGGTVTALTTGWEAFRTNLVSAGADMHLLHGPNKAGTPIPAPDPVTNLVVENQVATQRRRMRR